MNVLEVKFKPTGTSMCIIYSSMSHSSPIVGTLSSSSCNGMFYCDLRLTDKHNNPPGHNGFYKLYEPKTYGLDITDGYVLITNNPDIESTKTVDIQDNTPKMSKMRTAEYSAIPDIGVSSTDAKSYADKGYSLGALITPEISGQYTEASLTKLQNVNTNLNYPTNDATYESLKTDLLSAFARYNVNIPESKLTKAFPKIFITRPDLNLFSDLDGASSRDAFNLPSSLRFGSKIAKDVWFQQTYNTDPHLLASLTQLYTNDHMFNPFLSNMAQSFDISDEKLETAEHGETFTGWKVKYGRHTNATRSAGSFSISYSETNRIEIYKIHKAWVDYISKVYRGEVNADQRYIEDMRIDYACSVYYFLCAEDGETVLFWSKYVGVFPTSIPASQFSWSKGDIIKMPENSVEYDYAWKEDMDPASLMDFNYNSHIENILNDRWINDLKVIPTYNTNIMGPGYAFGGKPFILINKDADGKFVVRLKYASKLNDRG